MKYKVFDLTYECDVAEFDILEDAQEFIFVRAEEKAYNDYLTNAIWPGFSIEGYINHFEEYAYKEYEYETWYGHALCFWDGYMIRED